MFATPPDSPGSVSRDYRTTDREIHVVDSMGASMSEGILAELGVEMARMGVSATEISSVLTRRRDDPTSDAAGAYLYLRDPWTNEVWSATHLPVCRAADRFDAE